MDFEVRACSTSESKRRTDCSSSEKTVATDPGLFVPKLMKPLRVLIVDDHEVIRRGLRSLLSSRPEWEICGEAADGRAAIERAKALRPDVILMDVSMPEMGGTESATIIHREVPEAQIIIISQNDPEITRRQAESAGAAAYVAKSDLSRDLLSTIERVSSSTLSSDVPPAATPSGDQPSGAIPWLVGGGAMGALMRSKDWRGTPLGPLEDWPQSLKVTAGICISSRFDLIVWWGPELIMLYNDSYCRTLGEKHPRALGSPGREVYPEIWDVIGPMLDHVLETGEATWSADLLLLLERNGYPEESYHTFSYTPIRDERGQVVGVITPVSETTDEVISQRRLLTLRDLAARSVDAKNESEAWEFAAKALSGNPYDIPCAVLYKFNDEDAIAHTVASAGITSNDPFLLNEVSLSGSDQIAGLIRQVLEGGQAVEFNKLEEFGISLPGGFWGVSPKDLILLPIGQTGQESAIGVLVAGVNRHKKIDEDYLGFLELVAGQIAKSVADARLSDAERKRAESLAALDHAKTAFFSNISHELRTPLTLILGPLEDFLSRGDDSVPVRRDEIELAHRNALRLLKLVNTLLDFSRMEADRVQATYRPVDLASTTAEIASVFRSAIEKAGLQFEIQCDELEAPAYVDPQMWEKIVLNLVSNAFKFTPAGKITVHLRPVNGFAELAVEDTGVGIPKSEMPRIFERFHRVEGTHGRTHEGTGIGLALVQELVKLHGGTIRAESELGKGSRFVVSIPLGRGHLPEARIDHTQNQTTAPTRATTQAYVEEVHAWLPEGLSVSGAKDVAVPIAEFAAGASEFGIQPRVLLVEDNADMRSYLQRLLSEQGYSVEGVGDGQAALEVIQTFKPDLVLSDVMLPKLDGIGLLRAIRENSSTASIPVILLSARAGEEFRIQGLGAGADDYLIKPFSARELLSRVKAHVESNQRRRESENRLAMALELGRIGTWDQNLRTGKIYWSPVVYSLHGYAPEECEASWEVWQKRVHPADYERVAQIWRDARAAHEEYGYEYRVILPDDKIRWLEVKGRFFCDESGEPYRDLGAAQDITDRKIVEERLRRGRDELEEQVRGHRVELQERASEAATQAELLDLVNDAAFTCSLDASISYWNRGAERLYGWKQADVVGRNASELLQTQFPIPIADLHILLRRDGRWEGELVQTTRYGLRMTVYSRWTCKYGENGELIGWLEINSDMTQQRQAEETARRLSGRILQVQDDERRRMARDLHDSLGQYLAMLKICIDGSLRTLSDPAPRKLIEQAREMVEQCVSETRTLSHLLHPPLLDENGLASAVRWYVEGFSSRSGIEAKLNMPRVIPRFVNEIETTLFRILQEGLTNVHRHSQSKRVDIDISHDQHTVSLVIRDYGLGISVERIRAFRDRGSGMGVGLGGMRERVREVGGTLRIEPGKDSGTVITVEIPLVERPEKKFSDDLSEIAPAADSLRILNSDQGSQGRPN
jgi:PAS domain S-box-containing protein